MKKIKSAVVKFTLEYDYTETVKEMLKDGDSLDVIKETILQSAYDDFNSAGAVVEFVIK